MSTDKSKRTASLREEFEAVNKLLNNELPKCEIEIAAGRSSSRFRIIAPSNPLEDFKIVINERLYRLNDERRILKAFRHACVHLWQAAHDQRMSHTKAFDEKAKKIKASDPDNLAVPAPKYKLLYYICPTGCQQFSTPDAPAVICVHCGVKMKALYPKQYRKMKQEQREQQEAARKALKEVSNGTANKD